MELTKITNATLVSAYPAIQSENMEKIEQETNALQENYEKLKALGLYIDSDGDISQL